MKLTNKVTLFKIQIKLRPKGTKLVTRVSHGVLVVFKSCFTYGVNLNFELSRPLDQLGWDSSHVWRSWPMDQPCWAWAWTWCGGAWIGFPYLTGSYYFLSTLHKLSLSIDTIHLLSFHLSFVFCLLPVEFLIKFQRHCHDLVFH